MNTVRRWWKARPNFISSKPWYVRLASGALLLLIITVVSNYLSNVWAFWDQDPDRGAVVIADDVFGDKVTRITYLDGDARGQGWEPKDTLWFDNITQGSDLLPYDFFLVLRQKGSKELFRSDRNMNNRYRYLVRKATFNNPDALPVGIVKDNYLGKDFMGFTCAACHTGQINYRGVGMRIDGAPAMADMDTFLTDLSAALRAANFDPVVNAQFIRDVIALGNYRTPDEVRTDLRRYALRLTVYRVVNKSDTHYGFARLDAFGRIYNQVLEYVLTARDAETALAELVQEKKIAQTDLDRAGISAIIKEFMHKPTLNGNDRDRLFEAFMPKNLPGDVGQTSVLSLKQFLYFRDKLFNQPDAPVSYPFLWDIPQHDYVQWNGIAPNAGLGPIGRNTGEVIGVFGSMNWSRSHHWTLAGVFSGQGLFNTSPLNFSSSVNVHNLALIEDHLKNLHSPVWPENILPKLDMARVSRGRPLFNTYCASCHTEIDRTVSDRRVVAHMSAQDNIKTDPMMAVNGARYHGYSGILRNEYVSIGPGSLLLDQRALVAALLTKVGTGVVATPDASKWWPRRFVEWVYDVIFSLRNNNIQASLKRGDYHSDTSADPLASVVSYKGRSLNGIWATAPYLHNGSVPTLYDLLLPASQMPSDPPDMKYRPSEFMVGSREFDPIKVGFKTDGYAGFLFYAGPLIPGDATSVTPGNSNAGHEYGTRDEKLPDGSILPALTEEQRWDLVEYLKSL